MATNQYTPWARAHIDANFSVVTPQTHPGLERNALRVFGIPYAELIPKHQEAVRNVTVAEAGKEMLAALKNFVKSTRPLIPVMGVYDSGTMRQWVDDITPLLLFAEDAITAAEGRL